MKERGSITKQFPHVTDEQWLELPWVKDQICTLCLEIADATAAVHSLTVAQAKAELAIALHLQGENVRQHCRTPYGALDSWLTWDRTPQAHSFWSEVAGRLRGD
jgi:hypothetical protein